MVPEILFLKGLWEFNRRLWLSSFLFHFGLYLLIGTVVLVAITSGLVLVEPSMGGGSLWTALTVLYKVTGCAGAILTIIGALLLLLRRATDKGLKNYTKPADFFNLLFFIVTFLVVAAAYLLRRSAARESAGWRSACSALIRMWRLRRCSVRDSCSLPRCWPTSP